MCPSGFIPLLTVYICLQADLLCQMNIGELNGVIWTDG